MSFDNSIYHCHRRETHALKPIFIKSLGVNDNRLVSTDDSS